MAEFIAGIREERLQRDAERAKENQDANSDIVQGTGPSPGTTVPASAAQKDTAEEGGNKRKTEMEDASEDISERATKK